MFGSRLVTIAVQMCLIFGCELVTESTWKILKLDWKTPGIFFFQKSGNPVMVSFLFGVCIGINKDKGQ